jgi:hypothetical protein
MPSQRPDTPDTLGFRLPGSGWDGRARTAGGAAARGRADEQDEQDEQDERDDTMDDARRKR